MPVKISDSDFRQTYSFPHQLLVFDRCKDCCVFQRPDYQRISLESSAIISSSPLLYRNFMPDCGLLLTPWFLGVVF